MTYTIRRLPEDFFVPMDRVFDPATVCGMECAQIDQYPWDVSGHRPTALAWVGWNDRGLYVVMAAREATIRQEGTVHGGAACQDSCLEFFVDPFPEADRGYINVEVTPRPMAHIGFGVGRGVREVLTELPTGMDLLASPHAGGWWAVSYRVPASFLMEKYGKNLSAGQVMRGNFYKCGDLTDAPHWGQWAAYDTLPKPDFHRPELFQEMVLG